MDQSESLDVAAPSEASLRLSKPSDERPSYTRISFAGGAGHISPPLGHDVVVIDDFWHDPSALRAMALKRRRQRDDAFHVRQPARFVKTQSAIADAVLSGDVDRVARVSDEHIRYTFNTVREIRRDEERLEASLRRLDRSDLLSSRDAGPPMSDGDA